MARWPLKIAAALSLVVCLCAQEPDLARLRKDVNALASPAMEGRATGTEGQRKAQDYVSQGFREAGLAELKHPAGADPYVFPYTLVRTRLNLDRSSLTIGKVSLKVGEDILTARTREAAGDLLFIGFGIHAPELKWDDYAGLDLKGRWVAMWEGRPQGPEGADTDRWNRVGQTETKLEWARKAHVAGCLFIQVRPDKEAGFGRLRVFLGRFAKQGQLGIKGAAPHEAQILWMSAEAAKALQLEVKSLTKPEPPRSLGPLVYLPKATTEEIPAANLAGVVPGASPELKDDFIVLSAHHDHLGMAGGRLHPGADDNASGTAALLEVARLLKDSKPRRSILVLSVSGEELGLWGSQAFLEAPPVALSRIKADINVDMVGRNAVDELSVTPAQIEGAVGTLTRDARELASREGLKLTLEADKYWTRSDHFTFAKRGIPCVFFFGGMHADYHEPSDTPDKINFEKVARVVRLVRDLALRVANAEAQPKALPKEVWAAWTWPLPLLPPVQTLH
ncbi:MAG: M20/M25/M40 family metallo-hydrolase [Acidobacteriota bacterium]|nr:M20/M25/M40 family metallo-hydrolase [Acidobacteriota bacterium]